MAKRCAAPRTVKVKGHWRIVKARRKKRTGPRAAKGRYWVAENGSRTCGHHHKTFTAAVACARRTERHWRRRYGAKAAGTWTTQKRG